MAGLRKAAVIGAGASGVVTAKILTAGGWVPDVFEQHDVIGGTWNYDESCRFKHSAMYKNLRFVRKEARARLSGFNVVKFSPEVTKTLSAPFQNWNFKATLSKTNLPKELMLLEGLDYPMDDRSYLTHEEILQYLNQYVEKFELRNYIQFHTKVTNVSKMDGGSWQVKTLHLPSNTETSDIYDSVFVCNGHYFEPQVPDVHGAECFKGNTIHSHRYRVPESFLDQSVLIIGSGPSGRDIAVDLSPYVKKVYLSNHESDLAACGFPDTVLLKPDVARLEENSVTFVDNSNSEIESIIYCTGYKFSFPFLDESCRVKVDENYVSPLYGQLINIQHPTMFFIGLPFRTFIFQMLELQAKSCIRILNGDKLLPTQEEMEEARKTEVEKLKNKGWPKRKYHLIAGMVEEYLNSVAQIGGLPPLQKVFFKIYEHCGRHRKNEFMNYRNYCFKILDSQKYAVHYGPPPWSR